MSVSFEFKFLLIKGQKKKTVDMFTLWRWLGKQKRGYVFSEYLKKGEKGKKSENRNNYAFIGS